MMDALALNYRHEALVAYAVECEAEAQQTRDLETRAHLLQEALLARLAALRLEALA